LSLSGNPYQCQDMTEALEEERAMMGFGWGMGLGGWIFMGLFWVVAIGLIVWALVALVPTGHRSAADDPRDILDRRFALGELDTEQYQRAREELTAARAAKR
jgi:putative membrane protein